MWFCTARVQVVKLKLVKGVLRIFWAILGILSASGAMLVIG
jgi:hypothetical protein